MDFFKEAMSMSMQDQSCFLKVEGPVYLYVDDQEITFTNEKVQFMSDKIIFKSTLSGVLLLKPNMVWYDQ